MTSGNSEERGMPAGEPSKPEPSLAAMQDEIARLRTELERLEAAPARPRRGAGLRGMLTWVLVFLASFALVLSAVAIWAHAELFDTNRMLATVEPILRDPAVATSLSARVSEELILALDIRGRAQEALPDRAKFLAAAIASAAQTFVRLELERLFNNVRFQDSVLAAIGFAHEQIISILRGKSEVILIQDGVVTLNLFPLVDAGLRRIEATGLLPPGIMLPNLRGTEAPSAARQQLSQAIGTRLPDNFGEITLFESQELEQAKRAVRIFDALVIVLPIITLIFGAGALILSSHRRRTALQLGLGVAIGLLFARLIVRLVQRAVVSAAAEDPTSGAVVSAAVTALANSLTRFTTFLIIAGIVVAVAAFLAGRPSWFVAGWDRARAAAGRAPSEAVIVRWVDDHLDLLRIAGVAVAIAGLFVVRLSWGVFLLVVLLLIIYQLGLSYLQGRRPPPNDAVLPAGGPAST